MSSRCSSQKTPLFNPKTKRCIQNTNANRKRISSYKTKTPVDFDKPKSSRKAQKSVSNQSEVKPYLIKKKKNNVSTKSPVTPKSITSQTSQKDKSMTKQADHKDNHAAASPKPYLRFIKNRLWGVYGRTDYDIYATIGKYLTALDTRSAPYRHDVKAFVDDQLPKKLAEAIKANSISNNEWPTIDTDFVLELVAMWIMYYVEMNHNVYGDNRPTTAADYSKAIQQIQRNEVEFPKM